MLGPQYLERFLADSDNRRQTLEFLEALATDAFSTIEVKSRDASDPLDPLIARLYAEIGLAPAQKPGAIVCHIQDVERHEFVKKLIAFLISNQRVRLRPTTFLDGWEPLKDLIDELLAEGIIWTPQGREGEQLYFVTPDGRAYLSEMLIADKVRAGNPG